MAAAEDITPTNENQWTHMGNEMNLSEMNEKVTWINSSADVIPVVTGPDEYLSIVSYSCAGDADSSGLRLKHSIKQRFCNTVLISTAVIVLAVMGAAFIFNQLGGINGNAGIDDGGNYKVFQGQLHLPRQGIMDGQLDMERYREELDGVYGKSPLKFLFNRSVVQNVTSSGRSVTVDFQLFFLRDKNDAEPSDEEVHSILAEATKLSHPRIPQQDQTIVINRKESAGRVAREADVFVNKRGTPSSGDAMKQNRNRTKSGRFQNRTKSPGRNSPVYTLKLQHGENLHSVLSRLLADLSLGKRPDDLKMNPNGLDSNTDLATSSKLDTLDTLDQKTRIKIGSDSENEISITEFSNDIFEEDKVNTTAIDIATTFLNVSSTNPLCDGEKQFRCANGQCVSLLSRCNQMKDCADNSDEMNCKCADFFRAQFLNRKICDGIVDCWDFSDENECDWCTPDKYICSNSKTCIDQHQICDGVRDCPSGDDEKYCISIAQEKNTLDKSVYVNSGYVMIRRKGQWGKLCSQNFDSVTKMMRHTFGLAQLGKAVCSAATFNSLDRIDRRKDNQLESRSFDDVPYFEITEAVTEQEKSTSAQGRSNSIEFRSTQCTRKEVIHVTCQNLACGVRPKVSPARARIVGGGNAAPGAWPWQAALYKEGDFQCGATLINDRWLLSAGHCFYHSIDDHWVARLGALRRGSNLISPYEQIRTVTHVLIHPQYVDTGFINDISLLRIDTPVQFTDYVRPVCLPQPDAEIRDGRFCTVVGWGQLQETGRIFPDTLQEVQLPMLSTEECRKRTLFLPLYRLTNNMFCAGFDRGGRDACLGDSGGPLMCQEDDGRWSVYGVTSNGYGCARANRPGVYTKVSRYTTWINSVVNGSSLNDKRDRTQCAGHRCLLGECLPLSHVCNGIAECSDSSDEQNCS